MYYRCYQSHLHYTWWPRGVSRYKLCPHTWHSWGCVLENLILVLVDLLQKSRWSQGPVPISREFSFWHLFSHPSPFFQLFLSNFSRKDVTWSMNLLEGKCLILVWTGEKRIDCCSTFHCHKATDKTDNTILENLVSNKLRKVILQFLA